MTQYVGIDLDGVLADFTFGWRQLAARLFGDEDGLTVHSTGGQKDWYFISDEQAKKMWAEIDASNTWWSSLECLIGLGEITDVHRVAEEFEIIYLTSRDPVRSPSCKGQTLLWLYDNGLPQGRLEFASNKPAFWDAHEGELVGHLDDSPAILQSMRDAGYNIYARDWPYNREVKNVKRVSSVSEFCIDLISDLYT